MTYLRLIILCLAFSFAAKAEKSFTISGSLKDNATGEELIGATIYVEELKTGVSTNVYGFYSITLPQGTYNLVYSFLGYSPVKREILLNEDKNIDIQLVSSAKDLKEIQIIGEKRDQNVRKAEMSTTHLPIKTIQRIPALMGEVDIIKSIQLLPGVQTAGEGTSGFYVRGGAVDQNLILLDDATVYNASHFGGFFSVFNQDAVKDVKLFKGGIPAEYGGRLASLLDIRMKDGNSKKMEATGGIGLLASRLTLEAPVIKNKSSFILSGRRTYADIFFPFLNDTSIRKSRVYFYDLNAKINYQVNPENRIFISGYFGDDIMKFGKEFGMHYGNRTFTIRYNHLFSKKIFSNFVAIYSKFDYGLGSPEGVMAFNWNSNIVDQSFKNDYTYYLNPQNTIKFGFSTTYHIFMPGYANKASENSIFNPLSLPDQYAFEHALFLSNEQKLSEKLTIQYGLRFSAFQNMGKGTFYNYDKSDPKNYTVTDSMNYVSRKIFNTYSGFEPRLNIVVQIDPSTSLKTSYNRTLQYIHLATNTTSATPLDVWFPCSKNVKPQKSDQVAFGIFKNFLNNSFETSIEAYYKEMQNVIDFRDHAQLLLNKQFEAELRIGSGYSYGLEVFIKKQEGKLSGWISYTWSRSMRKIPEINHGNVFPAPYDKPHNISIVGSYQVTERISINSNWVFSTGSPRTMPTGRYVYDGMVVPIYSDRNSVRLPNYHRMDFSVTIDSKKTKKNGTPKKFEGSWNFSIYNVYNRHNAYAINFKQNEKDPMITEAEKMYLFKVFPSITYNFKF